MTATEFSSYVQRVSSSLSPAALQLTRDADDANDLVQETLLKALVNKEKFTAGTNLKGWLYTIMRNTFINNYNKVTKRNSTFDCSDSRFVINHDESMITQNKAGATFVMNDINAAIADLCEEHRIPFMMYFGGYKYLEIAELLKIPIGTVKNRIHLARKELKEMLWVYRLDV